MRLYDQIGKNPQILREVGIQARAKARQAGVPLYYEDPSLGDGIVEEMPDGSRRLMRRSEDEKVASSGSH